ncbi:MAG: N4-(beta-N-acetylglucosaminyl)-L-asparaginase [Gaiellales bacterium]|jgi:beta-aspartyl-peptidase (threonine type)|nr:N4-(beta-N-acetylglucosaminyl)-L-asparaginase [Gaiellales bacterium]
MSDAIMIASERGEVGLPAGVEILRAGGSALDAVEAAVREVESNPDDHWVGVGGLPNLLGVVELDASIMDGRTRAAGAVAAVRGYAHPISIARLVMERLPQHLMLVGEGAERFAAEMGFQQEQTLTDEAARRWREGLDKPSWDGSESPGDRRYREAAHELMQRMAPPTENWGTVNIIARDARGDLCVGVSTSGYPWKYPGRVGDSPIIGAGNYCDNRAGAAGCTGRGELAIRAQTARMAVERLAAGSPPQEACLDVLREAAALEDEFRSPLQVLAMAQDGSHGAASSRKDATYSMMTAEMREPEILLRRQLD